MFPNSEPIVEQSARFQPLKFAYAASTPMATIERSA
jgi:hypothetical protein